MTDVGTILNLIENVDPADTATLKDLEARTWCYLRRYNFKGWNDEEKTVFSAWYRNHETGENLKNGCFNCSTWGEISRSRNDLKEIRPDGWFWDGEQILSGKPLFMFRMSKFVEPDDFDNVISPHLPTEELAELHAIIQAIAYERNRS